MTVTIPHAATDAVWSSYQRRAAADAVTLTTHIQCQETIINLNSKIHGTIKHGSQWVTGARHTHHCIC